MSSNKRVLERGESSASGYDLDLNDYATNNYKEKLESDHRRMSQTTNSQFAEFEDDDYFAETGSQLPTGSQYPSQDTPWMKVLDEVSGSYYYFNTITGESTWEKPLDFIDEPTTQEANQQQLQQPTTSYPEIGQSGEPHDKYDFTWNEVSLRQIKQNWNPQSENHEINDTTSVSFRNHQENGFDSVDDHHHHEAEETEDPTNRLQLSSQTNLMNKAYGTLYDSQHLIVDEKTAIQNKFQKMKRGGTLLREQMGWEEWLSPQGALFYLKKGL
jgi:hypothetical protein